MPAPSPSAPERPARELPVAVIGAGFGGIGAAVRLKQEGFRDFTVFERAHDVGGTWRDNTYPGAACDVPSHVYCFSFEPKPDWSRRFAESQEIWAYLRGVVEKHGLRPHLRLGTEIVEARFDETDGTWTLTTDSGERHVARAVIAAAGGLVDPSFPDLKGLSSFRGEILHTARWDHDYELTGRRVGVVGTGASAVQVVPNVAPQVAKLTVFQRTPGWVVPKNDKVYGEATRRRLARFPFLLRASRLAKYWLSELFGPMIFLDSERLSRIGEKLSLAHLRQQVKDPELRRKLTPDFQFGCKRILISDDYWATFERENVELETDPIDEVLPEGVCTRSGRVHELDAIVFATGFQLNLATPPFPVAGRGGLRLEEVWKEGAQAYKGLAVSGFPNWFILMGPNTGPGHTSVLVYTEAQIEHALQALRKLRDEDVKFVDVRPGVQERYNEGVQARMKHMVWSSGCSSWYLSPDGKNRALYPGLAAEYVLRARRFRPADYEIVRA